MDILVSDTSVIIDLERAQLIEEIFSLPFRFVVPGALFEREMRDYGGEKLVALGLEVWNLTGTQVQEAQRLRRLERRISVHDSYALALAKTEGAIVLTGDGALRIARRANRDADFGPICVPDQDGTRVRHHFVCNPTDRPPAIFDGKVTLHFGPARQASVLLPIIPAGAAS